MAGVGTVLPRLRKEIIISLSGEAQSLLLEPDLGKQDPWQAILALGRVLEAYEGLVEAHHNSSSRAYAFRDLPSGELECYQSAKHCLRSLLALHGPQEGTHA